MSLATWLEDPGAWTMLCNCRGWVILHTFGSRSKPKVLGVTSEDFLPSRNWANQSIPAVTGSWKKWEDDGVFGRWRPGKWLGTFREIQDGCKNKRILVVLSLPQMVMCLEGREVSTLQKEQDLLIKLWFTVIINYLRLWFFHQFHCKVFGAGNCPRFWGRTKVRQHCWGWEWHHVSNDLRISGRRYSGGTGHDRWVAFPEKDRDDWVTCPHKKETLRFFNLNPWLCFVTRTQTLKNVLGQLHFVEHVICKRRPLLQAIDVGKPSEVLIEALRRPVEEQGYGT